MASTNRARKNKYKTNTRGSASAGQAARKPKPDMNARWSILLFGIGVLVFALIVVPGVGVELVRTNILFGVFGRAVACWRPCFCTLPYCGPSAR